MINEEGGIDPRNRSTTCVDRVNTTATVWLGTTIACAQCHDHKYDPFSQKDYFRLLAFFNNADRAAGHRATARATPRARLDLASPEQESGASEGVQAEIDCSRRRS